MNMRLTHPQMLLIEHRMCLISIISESHCVKSYGVICPFAVM